jgi:hypothetical protein
MTGQCHTLWSRADRLAADGREPGGAGCVVVWERLEAR